MASALWAGSGGFAHRIPYLLTCTTALPLFTKKRVNSSVLDMRRLSSTYSSSSSSSPTTAASVFPSKPTWSVNEFFDFEEEDDTFMVTMEEADKLFAMAHLRPREHSRDALEEGEGLDRIGKISKEELQQFLTGMHTVMRRVHLLDTETVEPLYTPLQELTTLKEREDVEIAETRNSLEQIKVNAGHRLDGPFFVMPKASEEL